MFQQRPWSQGWWFNSQPSFVVASLDKMPHNTYVCLVESNKQQIVKVRNKIQAETLETRSTPKQVWIRPMHSAFSRQDDEKEEIKNNALTVLVCW